MKTRFFFACLLSSALAWADGASTGPATSAEVDAAVAVKIYKDRDLAYEKRLTCVDREVRNADITVDDVRLHPAYYLEFNDKKNVAYFANFFQSIGQYPAKTSKLPLRIESVVDVIFASGRKETFLSDGEKIYRTRAGQTQAFDCLLFRKNADIANAHICYKWSNPQISRGGQ